MKARLIKHGHSYALLKEGKLVAFAHPEDFSNNHTIGKLSLKNCRSIERGYDLDELAEKCSIDWNGEVMEGSCGIYKEGFQKCLETLGDKKFSEENMLKAFITGVFTEETSDHDFEFTELIKDLQQTEWDCIVEMDAIPADRVPNGWDTFPKLDADGCLILKCK